MTARSLKCFTLTTLCALAGILALAATPAGAAKTRRLLSTFGGASSRVTNPYPLKDPQGMAVDNETEDVYVADMGNHRVEKFSPTGEFLLAFGGNVGGPGVNVCGGVVACTAGGEGSAPGDLPKPQFVAVDNDPSSPSYHDVYVADAASQIISKFTSEGALVESWGVNGQLTGSTTEAGPFASVGGIGGIAVGVNGTLYIANLYGLEGGGHCFEFAPNSAFAVELRPRCGAHYPVGIGVNPEGSLFAVQQVEGNVIEESGSAGNALGRVWSVPDHVSSPPEVRALTAASNGELYFTTASGLLENDAFTATGEVLESNGRTCPVGFANRGPEGSLTPCENHVSDSVEVVFAASGLAVASSSGDTFLANPAEGTVYRFGPPTTAVRPERPVSEQALEVAGESVKLQGVLKAGVESESGLYEFLYERSSEECELGQKTQPVPVVWRGSEETVSASVGELLPNTAYTFCLRMRNGVGEQATGAPVTFRTPVVALAPRELGVSDVAASSATLSASVDPGGAMTSYAFEVAVAGGAFAPVAEATGAGTLPEGTQGVPVRVHTQRLRPATVYEFRISVKNSAGTAVSNAVSFTTQAPAGALALPDGRQWELVSPPNKQGAEILPIDQKQVVQTAAGGDAVTYVTTAPTESEPASAPFLTQVFSVRGAGGWASHDISPPHKQLAPLILGAQEWYVAFSEDLSRAVVQPMGPFEASLSAEASEQTPYLRTNFLNGNVEDLCKANCYRPLVTAKQGYANVPPGTNIDGSEECPPSPQCGPTFEGATPDLSRIWLKSTGSPLLLGGLGHDEHLEWVDGRLAAESKPQVRRVSTSTDGSWSYFVSAEALAPGANPGNCQAQQGEGLCNLYVKHDGATKLVAALSSEDGDDWVGASEGPSENDDLYRRTSRVSPDGRWFAFMSLRELTGYNTHDALSGRRDEEVYLYHAPENLANETGTLVCASCNPTGAHPIGFEYHTLEEDTERHLVSGASVWPADQWIAANVPGWTPYSLKSAIYQSRYLSDGGRLFFNTADALVSQDVNGDEDVYEYEPPGMGDCTTGSVLYSPRSGGCVGLVSSGQAAGESAFLDASETGGDVFFLTRGRLVSQDYDSSLDVYDAHECTSAAPCFPVAAVPSPACDTGDACKSAASPQPAIYGAPSSQTFSGAGNPTAGRSQEPVLQTKAKGQAGVRRLVAALRSCHARRGRRRRACERQARARFARKASGMGGR